MLENTSECSAAWNVIYYNLPKTASYWFYNEYKTHWLTGCPEERNTHTRLVKIPIVDGTFRFICSEQNASNPQLRSHRLQ